MYKWISEHKIISFILYSLICWSSFLLVSLIAEVRFIWWVIFGIFISLIAMLFIFSTDQYLLNRTIKHLNEQCDPNPLLETSEQQLQIVKSKTYRQLLLINKSVALRDLGHFNEVFSILSSINIDQYSSTLPLTKIVYYNNWIDILIIRGDFFQANIWYSKMMQMLNDIKMAKKQKQQLYDVSFLNQAELLLDGNNFDEVENKLKGLPEDISNRHRISKCMLYAKLYIKQNKPDEAKQYLKFVIDYGNKLYDVVQARQLLSELG